MIWFAAVACALYGFVMWAIVYGGSRTGGDR